MAGLLAFAEALSARTAMTREHPAVTTAPEPAGFTPPAYGDRSLGDVVPAVARALGVDARRAPGRPRAARPRRRTSSSSSTGWAPSCSPRYAHAAPYLSSLLEGAAIGTAGVPSTTATSLTSLGTGLVPGAHGLVGFTARIPGTDRLLNHLWWDKGVDPRRVAAAPDRVRAAGARRRPRHRRSTSATSTGPD